MRQEEKDPVLPGTTGQDAPLEPTPRRENVSVRPRFYRSEELLRSTLSMLCHFVWHKQLRQGEHMWSIPVDFERDFDCIFSDAISELVARRKAEESAGEAWEKAAKDVLGDDYADLLATRIGRSLGDCVRQKFNAKSDEIGSPVKLAAGVEAGSPLRALIAEFRANAEHAGELAQQHEGDSSGNSFAFLKERRVWTEAATKLEALLSAPVASARYENAQCVTCGKDLDTEEETQARLSAPVASGWQPIATAPKDGMPVRLKWEGTTVEAIGRWKVGKNLRYAEANWHDVKGDDVLIMPTHWLPAAPVSSDKEQE
jgi:hypothetical protein